MRIAAKIFAILATGVAVSAAGFACSTAPPPPVAEPAAMPALDPRLQPPAFAPIPVATPEARAGQRTTERREILDAAWRTVRDRHYDPRLGGVDWNAVRQRYEPLALGAPSDAAFYRALNDMLAELGQSHMMVTGPGASDEDGGEGDADGGAEEGARPRDDEAAGGKSSAPASAAASPGIGTTKDAHAQPAPISVAGPPGMPVPVAVTGIGDPGLTVRVIDGRPTVTAVRAGSSAVRHRIAPGFIVVRIGGRPLSATPPHKRPLRPVEERFAVRRTALHRLQGPSGTKVTIDYLDNDDRPGQAILDRDEPPGPVRQIGHLPPLHPEARVQQVGDIGVIAFNIFLLDPLLAEIQQAMDRFRTMHVKGVILDLRGNPGGLGAMAIPVAAEFVSAPTTLGTLQFRTFSQTFTAQPSIGRSPYPGPLVILTDEGTASASEILAAGLQEAGRARVVGDATLGAVLPSVVESLPHGAIIQVVVADFKTPKGILVEGRGVQPDRRVLETRAGFRAGRDAVMDAAIVAVKTWRARR